MLVAKELLPNAAEHILQEEVKLVSLSPTLARPQTSGMLYMQTHDYLNANVCSHFTATSKLSSSGLMLVTKAVSDVLVASVVVPESSPLCRTTD